MELCDYILATSMRCPFPADWLIRGYDRTSEVQAGCLTEVDSANVCHAHVIEISNDMKLECDELSHSRIDH